jgi:tRNA threonylcarbamoyladenosine modification (KEOPS) complex  Pcc1 subunit
MVIRAEDLPAMRAHLEAQLKEIEKAEKAVEEHDRERDQ